MVTAGTNANMPPPYNGQATKHSYYYFDDGNLVLQVGNTLFKLWKGPLTRHSKYFSSKAADLDGAGDNPVVLEDVEEKDFERLLWILYPRAIGKYEAQTPDDWVAILGLAFKWQFDDIRDLAIKQLATVEMDPLQKISLQQKYKIGSEWAYDSYVTFCSRNDPLTLAEAEKLGLEATVKIASIREKLERWGRKKLEDVQKQVCEVFQMDKTKLA